MAPCQLTALRDGFLSQIFIQTHSAGSALLTLQFPAAKAPMAATTPKTSAILLSMEWHACLSRIWAWWNIENSRTKEEITAGITHITHIVYNVLGLQQVDSHRKDPALIVAVNREFCGMPDPLELEPHITFNE